MTDLSLSWRIKSPARLIDALKERVNSSCSARSIKRALESNVCRVNGQIERFGSASLQKGDHIELVSGWDALESKASLSYTILYEDDEMLCIDKPINAVCTDDRFESVLKRSVFLAHRLDKDTTGCLLFGKNRKAALELQDCFEQRGVEKEYLALVDGMVKEERGVIQSYLIKKGSFQGQTIWGSSPSHQGLFAQTSWRRLGARQNASLLLCQPLTGRTHQIRVHLAEMGHPILVDRQYAVHFRSLIFAARPLLHAKSLKIQWRGRSIEMSAPLPEDFCSVLKNAELPYDAHFNERN